MIPTCKQTLQVVAAPRPFSTVRIKATIAPGQTIAEILTMLAAKPVVDAHVWLGDEDGAIDPIFIPSHLWHRVRPKPGVRVTVRVIPAGGGGGSNPIRIIAMIAIAVLAVYTGGLAAGMLGLVAGTAGFAAVSAGVGFAVTAIGSMLVNALIPPPKPKSLGRSENSVGSEPSYTITGTQNRANPYGVVPRVYGRIRVYPVYGARPYSEAFGNETYLRLLFDFGYGPLDLSDMRIGTVPISQFEGISMEVRNGYDNDQPISLYTQTIREDGYNLRLTKDGGPQIVETRDETDEFTFDISFPALLAFTSKGKQVSSSVSVLVEYRAVGSSTWITHSTETATASTDRVYRTGVRIKPAARGRFQIRLTRQTADTSSPSVRNDCYLSTVRSIKYASPLRMKGHCIVSMRIKASDQLSGVVDAFSAIAQALLPVWDGTNWTRQATRNPAWAYCDVLMGAANRRRVTAERIDLPAILEWAQACDALAQDGQPKWTFDTVIDGPTTVFEVLRDIAAVGRASPGMRDGKFSIVRDAPQEVPVQVFTPRNSWGFRATKTFADRPDGMRVRYIDPDREWSQQEVTVYDDGHSEATAQKFETLDTIGVTRREQAWREGRYFLAVNRLRPEVYEFNADVEHLVCTRGDLIRVAHDVPVWGVTQGRVVAVGIAGGSVQTITLDEPITMIPGKSYALRVRHSDGAQKVHSIANVAGPTPTLTLISVCPASDAPERGDLAAFGEAERETVALLVKQIHPGRELTARLVCVDAAPAVHSVDTGPIPEFDPQMSDLPPSGIDLPAPPVVREVISDERALVRMQSGDFRARLLVVLEPRTGGASLDGVDVQFREAIDGAAWAMLPRYSASPETITIDAVEEGRTYDVRLRAFRQNGAASAWVTITGHVVIGKTAPPPAPLSLLVERIPGDMLRYRWTHEPPLDHAGYLLRWGIGGDLSWTRAVPAHAGLLTATMFESPAFATRSFAALVKAVDLGGRESDDYALALVNLGDEIKAHVVETFDYRALGWPGDIEGGAVVSGDISAALLGALFSNEAESLFDDPAEALGSASSPIAFTAALTPGHRGFLRLVADADGPVTMSVQRSGETPLFVNPSAPLPDVLFGVSPFQLYLGPFSVQGGQLLSVRIDVAGGPQPGVIRQFQASVEVPVEAESINDALIGPAGTRLPLARNWEEILNVSLTLQETVGSTAVRAAIIDKDPTGPLVRCYDASGGAVSGLVDATVQGLAA